MKIWKIVTLVFCIFMLVVAERVNIQEMKADFEFADSDNNGLLDSQELRDILPSLTEDDLSDFMQTADTDFDGVVSFEEFMHAHKDLQAKAAGGSKPK